MQPTGSFTGRNRRRRTSRAVRIGDALARGLITVGGIGTIVAVCTVCLYLAWVVLPLFAPARVVSTKDLAWQVDSTVLHLTVDESQTLGWALDPSGQLQSFRLDRDESFPPRRLFDDGQLTAASFPTGSETISLGFADGTIRLAEIRFAQAVTAKTHDPIDVDPDSTAAIVQLDHVTRGSRTLYCALTADNKLRLISLSMRRDPRTDQDISTRREALLPLAGEMLAEEPTHVLLAGSGDNVYVIWASGRLLRFDTRNLANVSLVEDINLLEDPSARVTAAAFLLGRGTLITGDSTGRLRAWFRVRPDGWGSDDAADRVSSGQDRLVCAHDLPPAGAAVSQITASARTRLFAASLADGRVRLLQATSERQVAEVAAGPDETIAAVALAPKDNGLAMLTPTHLRRWQVDAAHAEVTLSALFLPVWYEGYSRPVHVWQSSAAGQDFEPKLGLWPLIFGTIKATFYSMLFAVPIALLAAIYTSEFLHPRVKSKIKPTIELMASLPSVVLGFVAALLFAPVIARVVPVVLASFVTVPAMFLLGAYCWQLTPHRLGLLLARWRFLFIVLAVPLGLLAASAIGPLLERWLFDGDLLGWLDGQHGDGVGGWMLLLAPLCGVGSFAVGREVNTWLRHIAADWSRPVCALVDLAKFVVGLIGSVAVAWLLSWCLTRLGWDPRGMFVGTYDQRNALIVGFVMGFAIIPLIYTLAEDALSTVPEHLRSASLGAGATPWQTAVRIVIPTAMSGLFSAVMVGLGRAVGETMIVLMAAGNTPVRDWNIFNGFRTLSANIAVELPEAPVNTTHFRTLFLAALCLFVLTFLVNTVAEVVRQRFRRRAYAL